MHLFSYADSLESAFAFEIPSSGAYKVVPLLTCHALRDPDFYFSIIISPLLRLISALLTS